MKRFLIYLSDPKNSLFVLFLQAVYYIIISPYLLHFVCNMQCYTVGYTNPLSSLYCNCDCFSFVSDRSYSFLYNTKPQKYTRNLWLKS
jgi:hypothetical protein